MPALVALCLLAFLPGFFSLPPIDRDESRFAQASRQMYESVAWQGTDHYNPAFHDGGLAVPKVMDAPRLNKPPLIYWAQAASAAILTRGDPLRDAIWMYRVPSLFAAIASVLLTWRIGRSMFDPRTAWLAGALLAVAPVFAWEARQARADQLLVACTTLAMYALWHVFRRTPSHAPWVGRHSVPKPASSPSPAPSGGGGGPGWGSSASLLFYSLLFSFALALGIMTKGPVTPMIALLTILALCVATRSWRWTLRLRPILGVVIIAACVAPWVALVARDVGLAHYISLVRDETIGRSASAKEGHWGPPGYHLVALVVLFWPGSLLTGVALKHAFHRALKRRGDAHALSPSPAPRGGGPGRGPTEHTSRIRRWLSGFAALRANRPAELFLLCWIVPSWIVFELVSTKLPHYTMPLYPAIALLTARAAIAFPGLRPAPNRLDRIGWWVWWCIGLALVVALPLGLLTANEMGRSSAGESTRTLIVALAGVVALAGMLLAARRIVTRTPDLALRAGLIAQCAILTAFTAAIAPRLFALTKDAHEEMLEQVQRFGRDSDTTHSRSALPDIAWAGFWEDSVVFLTRGTAEHIEIDEAPHWFHVHPHGVIVCPNGSSPPWGPLDVTYSSLEIPGLHYTKGRRETLRVISYGGPVYEPHQIRQP
jgi:4-amino-4-deoxy-L-arabinose transferase-like glycosyltransferase